MYILMSQDRYTKNNHFEQLANFLLKNTHSANNPGLIHGKMGTSVLAFLLAQETRDKNYHYFAEDLIDEIYEEISSTTPICFETGLAGIGWGMEFLSQNKFIEIDTDEALKDLDNEIFNEIVYNTPRELSLTKGILGIGAYLLMRISNRPPENRDIFKLTNQQALVFLIDELDRKTQDISKIISEPSYDGSKIFDLLWDYPVTLWFLTELYNNEAFRPQTEKIIKRLIDPLSDGSNRPKLHSNKLLLSLALIRIRQTIELVQMDNISINVLAIELVTSNLLAGIDRNNIRSELSDSEMDLRYGALGVTLIYILIDYITDKKYPRLEAEYWYDCFFSDENIGKVTAKYKYRRTYLELVADLALVLLLKTKIEALT
jgi:hypothetical protein